MINWGSVPLGSVLPFHFGSYNSAGASVALTGLAVTDIEVYKGTTVTQRSSDAGYALIDTDGIDIDGITGANGFSIDTGDNTDAGFFVAGSFYIVWVSAVTIDSQAVNFPVGTFRLVAAENTAGVPVVDVSMFGGTAGTFSSGRPEVNTSHAAGTAWGSGAITAASIAADAITAAKVAADVTTELQSGLATAAALATVDTVVDAIKAVTDLLPDAGALTSLATAADLATVAGYLDTEIAAILADTNELQTDWVNGGRLDLLIDAIKAKTDNLPADPADASDVAALIAAVQADVDDLKSGIIYGAAATGTLSTTQATSNLSGYADDQLIGRVIIFLTGSCEGEATNITDYASASGLLTFTALTTAPGNGDTFKIV